MIHSHESPSATTPDDKAPATLTKGHKRSISPPRQPDKQDDSVPLIKKYVLHGAFLTLIVGTAWQGQAAAVTDRHSLLYNLIAGEEVAEGPLDPSVYASTDTPGIGGARLAVLDANVGIELITVDDPEVSFANTLGSNGNAVVGSLAPIVPEPGSRPDSQKDSRKSRIYTVQEDDTIAGIAAQFDVSENTILWANGLNSSDTINIGDHLTILPTTGVLHTVADGDTVSALAQRYDVSSKEITDYNGLSEGGAKLSIGQKLIVPGGYVAPRRAPTINADTNIATGPPPPAAKVEGSGLAWPTTTRHISQYFRWGHTGIDIDNRQPNTPIYAAAAGTVEFVGRLGGYGNLLIVNHGNGLQTYYAHNQKHYVGKGEKVTKGQAIAQMGSTGRSTGPHVHFEVRRNGRPVNPLSMY